MSSTFLSYSLRYQLFWASRKEVHYAFDDWKLHNFLSVVYNQEYVEILETEAGRFSVPSGQVILLPAGTRFRLNRIAGSTRAAAHIFYAIFDWSDVLSLYSVPLFPLGKEVNKHLRELVNATADCYWEIQRDGDSIPRIAKRDRIGFDLLETILSVSCEKEMSDKMFSGMQRLRPALQHMEENPNHNLSMAVLAAEINVSQSYFNKIFRQTMNMSPRAYLRSRIIQQALRLIAENNLSVGQIADRLGYADQFQFSKQFKQHVGLSPRNYKNRLR